MKIVYEGNSPVVDPELGPVKPGPNDVHPEKKAAAVAIAGSRALFRLMTGDEPFGGTITRTSDGATWDDEKGWVPSAPRKTKADQPAPAPAGDEKAAPPAQAAPEGAAPKAKSAGKSKRK